MRETISCISDRPAGVPWWRWIANISLIHWVALLLLTALAFWVRARFLEGPMRYDEAFTVWRYARNEPMELIADYSLPNNHVFHTLLVHVGIEIGGIHPDVVRMPAFAAGVLMVPTGFLAVSRFAGYTAGLFTAALITGSSLLVDYSANARGYTMAAGLSLLALGLITELRRGHLPRWSTRSIIAVSGVVGALGLWTVPIFAYPWAALLVWLAAPNPWRSGARRIIDAAVVGAVSMVGALLLYSPIILDRGLDALIQNRFIVSTSPIAVVETIPEFLLDVGRMWSHNMPGVLVALVAGGFVFSLWMPRGPEARRLSWSIVLGVVTVHLAIHAPTPPRVWTVLLPLALAASSSALGWLYDRTNVSDRGHQSVGAILAIGAALLMVVNVLQAEGNLSGENDGLVDAESIALDLASKITESDYVAAVGESTAPLRYYFELHNLPTGALRQPEQLPDEIFVVTYGAQSLAGVLEAVGVTETGIESRAVSEYASGSLWSVDLGA